MKVENYLTKEEIEETKGKSLKELQDIVARLASVPDDKPETELLCSPSFAKAHMGVIYLYLSNLRIEVHEKRPNSPRIKEIESMIETCKHSFKGLETLEERGNKYFDYKARLIESQTKILRLEKKLEDQLRINAELMEGLD